MAVDTRSAWVLRAETAVATLRGVEAARILADGDTIREIHVISTSNRPAKQIVRDVQSVLVTRFGREIDYRVVSVAYCEPGKVAKQPPSADRAAPPVLASVELAPPAPLPAPTPAPAPRSTLTAADVAPGPAPPRTGAPRGAAAEVEVPLEPVRAARDHRIRYVGVNLFVSGARTQAQVELRWKGLPRMGSASGWSTRDGALQLVAAATVAAVQEFLAEAPALAAQEVELVRLGRRRAVIVTIALLSHRGEKLLSGSCLVERDLQQAVVLATLAALNRLVGGLPAKEPTEYVLRPTST